MEEKNELHCEHEHEHEQEHHHEHEHHHEDHHHDHEHEHEHEHEHDHEHDHEHHHEHHHHDHDHEHHHHDHDHEHEHEESVPGYKIFESHVHEGATVCSFEKNLKMDFDEASTVMEQSIENIKNWLNESGAVIGHVKGYVKKTTSVRTFSTVGAELNKTDREEGGCIGAFASIVIGPTEDVLKEKVLEFFSALK